MSSIASATLIRDADGAVVAWEAHAGGSGDDRAAFRCWEQRWRDLGLEFTSDPETLTLTRRWGNAHTIVAQWGA